MYVQINLNAKSIVVTLFATLLTLTQLLATTISPFPNLGEMAKASEAVVFVKAIRNFTTEEGVHTRYRTRLQVIENIKGSLQSNDFFDIQNYHTKIGDLEKAVWGDLELKEGKNYLLFVQRIDNQLWRAFMLSYAAFEEFNFQGEKLLVPFDLGTEVHIHVNKNQKHPEPLGVYGTEKLINLLRDVVNTNEVWNRNNAITSHAPSSFEGGMRGVPPAHCTFLSGTPYARWPDFDISSLPIFYHEDGDPGCATAPAEIAAAMGNIVSSYTAVDLSSGGIDGTHAYVPTCGVDGATGDEFIAWINVNLGSSRNHLIQFDDPCSEITDLMTCNGTLAIGGLYWFSSTHMADGMTWRNAAYGYVVVNNDTGGCQCTGGTDYEIMMTHELTHSLNIGHIAGSGTANMNPECCNSITALDIECLDFIYNPAPLPVEVLSFEGQVVNKSIHLEWISGSESNNNFYTIEKISKSGLPDFMGKVEGAGYSDFEQEYNFIDPNPEIGTNYYRLSQTDYSGKVNVIDNIAVDFYDELQITLSPNPSAGEYLEALINTDSNEEVLIEIYDLQGNIVTSENSILNKGMNRIPFDLQDLSNGLYLFRAIQNTSVKTIRFVKS